MLYLIIVAAILTARFVEWVLIAGIKTWEDYQELKRNSVK